MEDLVTASSARTPVLNVQGLRVLVTGHTGFKGSWLCEWLIKTGAKVSGIALPPESPDSLFSMLRLEERLDHIVSDIRDATALADAVRRADPQIIFHLAAQALVRRSYREPLVTWQTNVGGTLNLLEAAVKLERPVTVVVVTTDKVYRNREWEFAYREEDVLGGYDPYSASKAACEIAVESWRSCFGSDAGVTVVTARAGNVLGAGDYSEDRIIPDCFRAWKNGGVVHLRNPGSTRPWQHVLEPLSGYIALAAHARSPQHAIDACNFGPGTGGDRSVETLVESMATLGPGRRWAAKASTGTYEARALSLSIERARHKLGWIPRLSFDETVGWTNEGYAARDGMLPEIIERQLAAFEAKGRVLTM